MSNPIAVSIAVRLAMCSPDELRVMDRVLAGLERGRDVYGPLDLSTDKRAWRDEGAAELRDLLVYLAAAEIAQWDARAFRCSCSEPHLHGHVVGCEGGRR